MGAWLMGFQASTCRYCILTLLTLKNVIRPSCVWILWIIEKGMSSWLVNVTSGMANPVVTTVGSKWGGS